LKIADGTAVCPMDLQPLTEAQCRAYAQSLGRHVCDARFLCLMVDGDIGVRWKPHIDYVNHLFGPTHDRHTMEDTARKVWNRNTHNGKENVSVERFRAVIGK
jgi:hypothetical protein